MNNHLNKIIILLLCYIYLCNAYNNTSTTEIISDNINILKVTPHSISDKRDYFFGTFFGTFGFMLLCAIFCIYVWK